MESYGEFIREDKNKRKYEKSVKTATRGTLGMGLGCAENDYEPVSEIFFSETNIKRIQNLIKKEIYNRTKGMYKLDADQDESDLLIVMRQVYYAHAKFLPYKIVSQTKDLNRKVINIIVPDMITNIKQAYAYIKEINQPIQPIMRPVNVNNAGRKTLPPLTSSFGF
jgi:hypothetical protein